MDEKHEIVLVPRLIVTLSGQEIIALASMDEGETLYLKNPFYIVEMGDGSTGLRMLNRHSDDEIIIFNPSAVVSVMTPAAALVNAWQKIVQSSSIPVSEDDSARDEMVRSLENTLH